MQDTQEYKDGFCETACMKHWNTGAFPVKQRRGKTSKQGQLLITSTQKTQNIEQFPTN